MSSRVTSTVDQQETGQTDILCYLLLCLLRLFAAESSTVHYDMYFTEYEISLMPDGDRQVLYQEPSEGDSPYWSSGSHRSHQFSTESPGGSRGQLGEESRAGEGKRKREHGEKQQRHHGLLSSGSSYEGHLGGA